MSAGPPSTEMSLQQQAGPLEMEQPSQDKQRKHSSVWVQCESCKSWRRLPKDLHEDVGGDDFWWVSDLQVGITTGAPDLYSSQAVLTYQLYMCVTGTARRILT